MKLSRYIHIEHLTNNTFFLYNYSNDKGLCLTSDLYNIYIDFSNKIDLLEKLHPTFFQALFSLGFILNNEVDNYTVAKGRIISKLQSSKTLKIIINPTLDCNLRCWYCYEKHKVGSFITSDTEQSILNYIISSIESGNYNNVDLAFFGGEPLLRVSSSLRIAETVKKSCELNGLFFQLGYISNGVLMTPKIIDRITAIDQTPFFQIAFDGGRSTHDLTKKTRSGKSTYDTIHKNIQYALSRGCKVNIRFNYTADNINSFIKSVDDFSIYSHDYPQLVQFNLQRVWQEYVYDDFIKRVMHFQNMLNNAGCNVVSDIVGLPPEYCYADYTSFIAINYNGDVYKCSAQDFTKENRVGKLLSDGSIEYDDRTTDLLSSRFHSFCENCAILPICSICHSKHREMQNAKECTVNLTPDDIKRQIRNRMKRVFPDIIKE